MMRSILLFSGLMAFYFTSYCQQKRVETIESHYAFTTSGKIDTEDIPYIDPTIIVSADLKVISDNHFCLFLVQKIILSNKSFANGGKEEADEDSLLFDQGNKIVYNLAQRKSYKYTERKYEITNGNNDSIFVKKADTLIVLSRTLNKEVCPVPTIHSVPYGILLYSAKKYSFTYVSSQKSNFSLQSVYDRCKEFSFATEKFRFIY